MKQRLPAFILFVFFSSTLFAADRYWVGGSGNWNDPKHWSAIENGKGGQSVPTSSDKVFLGFIGANYSRDTTRIEGSCFSNELT
ncbi:MAG TPA: hypothetical protein VFJ43_17435, partial [Bacteroidia bacterium]|nr:hypothetical protein [Bacteroidia bacterium]